MPSPDITPEAIKKMTKGIEECLEAGKQFQQALMAVQAQFPEALDRIFPEKVQEDDGTWKQAPRTREQEITSTAARNTEFCLNTKQREQVGR